MKIFYSLTNTVNPACQAFGQETFIHNLYFLLSITIRHIRNLHLQLKTIFISLPIKASISLFNSGTSKTLAPVVDKTKTIILLSKLPQQKLIQGKWLLI